MSKEARKQEILDAFQKLVGKFGLDKVTMQEVAREVGISVGAIYLNYANKDALIEAIEDGLTAHIGDYNRSVVESNDDPEIKIHRLIVVHLDNLSQRLRVDQGLVELLTGTLRMKYTGKKISDMRHEIGEMMVKSVTKCIKEGIKDKQFKVENPAKTARLIAEAFGEYYSTQGILSREHKELMSQANGLFNLLMKALKQPPANPSSTTSTD